MHWPIPLTPQLKLAFVPLALLLCPLPASPVRDSDISVQVFLDSVHTSGAGPNELSGAMGYPNGFVGRNRNIQLHRHKGNENTTVFLDLSNPLGCPETGGTSASVDIDFVAGCDPCTNGAPLLPDDAQFGTPDSSSGFPDHVRQFWIEGEDYDDLMVGCPVTTDARLAFEIGGQEWLLRWGSFKAPGGITPNPDSDPIRVERLDLDTWHFQTTGSHVAALYLNGGDYHGQYVVKFSGYAEASNTPPPPTASEEHCDVLMIPGDPACAPPPSAPAVTIDSPASGTNYTSGVAMVSLTGTAIDAEDGDISTSIEWFLNGDTLPFATGAAVDLLSPPDGSHIITAQATDLDLLSGSDSISISVGTPMGGVSSVDAISYSTYGGGGGNKHLVITIDVVDGLSSPVNGASVFIALSLNGSPFWTSSGTTDGTGSVSFVRSNAPSGTYVTLVTAVSAAGLPWDGITPTNSFTK